MPEFFADAEAAFDDARFVIWGYPFDGTACFRKGTADGPEAIRFHSHNFESWLNELGLDLRDIPAHDWGDVVVAADQEANNRAIEEIVGPERVRSLGIRSLSREELRAAREDGLSYVETGWTELREHLSDLVEALDGPLYLSLDMDAIDPAFAPGVGTPEPFGMTPYEVLQVLNFLSDRLVGFDCVETCPPADNGNTAALAARLVRHTIGAVAKAQPHDGAAP